MASVGKKYINKQYWANESSDDDDDDDSDLVVDEDVAVGAPPADDAPPQVQEVNNKKKRKRVSENVKRYRHDLNALVDNAIANPEEKEALITEFEEEHPPAKKRRTEGGEKENKKPKKYNGYQMFCKNKQDDVKNIPANQRMTELGKMWAETVDKTHWKTLADEENKRIDPTYEVKVPQEKKSVNPMLDWIMDRMSKMPQYATVTKKELRKIGENEIKEDGPMVAEYKRN
jgi:hypothetical protein